ncbi:MAG: hypothetical protein HY861_04280 [Chlamydiia bacterium]|nr:hypothetical protein [Chlamydiia bacterium]
MTPCTLILRHRRENLKKCSLAGLETREDLLFFSYPAGTLPPLSNYLLLKVGAPPLTQDDAPYGLLLIDGTWRLAAVMEKQLPHMEARSLPGAYRTAYPRKQTECPDPSSGLASIEALYLAHRILGRSCKGLLDRYHWKEPFLLLNELNEI